jgi:large subunit ribosomal protein L7/L12
MADLAGLVDDLSQLTVLEAAELAKMLEEKWGVSAAAPVVQTGGSAPSVAEPAVEQQTEFDAILTSFGESKVNVVKAIRAITQLDLKSAMALATECPKPIKTGVDRDEAERIKKEVEAVGGTVEIR